MGVEENEASADSDSMQLVWTDDKMHQEDCPVTVNIDHKDSFLSTGDGWSVLRVPNEAERKAYGYDPAKLRGVVVVVFTSCEWDKCEEKYIGPKDFNGDAKKWHMKINDTPVEKLVDIGHKAFLAKAKDGIEFTPSLEGDFKFEIKVDNPSQHVKVSSFIVY